jgi:hypothetical protein
VQECRKERNQLREGLGGEDKPRLRKLRRASTTPPMSKPGMQTLPSQSTRTQDRRSFPCCTLARVRF